MARLSSRLSAVAIPNVPHKMFSSSLRASFARLLLVGIFGYVASIPSVVAEDGSRTDERNKQAVFRHLRPVLKPVGGAARLYLFTSCEGRQSPLRFPRMKVQAASKGNVGLSGVREVFQNDKQVVVTQDPNGMIRIRRGNVPTALLKTKIHALRLKPDERYTEMLAVSAVLSAKEVEAAMRRLKLEHPVVVVSIMVVTPREGVPHLPAVMKDITLDEALDRVATTFGGIVISAQCTGPDGAGYFDADIEFPEYWEAAQRFKHSTDR